MCLPSLSVIKNPFKSIIVYSLEMSSNGYIDSFYSTCFFEGSKGNNLINKKYKLLNKINIKEYLIPQCMSLIIIFFFCI